MDHLFQGKVHPGVAVDQVPVKCFAVLELDEHRVPLGSGQEAEW